MDPTKHFLKVQQNLYWLKDWQVTWHEHVKAGLKSHHFKQSSIDPICLLKAKSCLFSALTMLCFSHQVLKTLIDNEIRSLKQAFNLMDEGKLKDYLQTHFIHHSDGCIELQQRKQLTIVYE